MKGCEKMDSKTQRIQEDIDQRNEFARNNYTHIYVDKINLKEYIEETIAIAKEAKYYAGQCYALVGYALHMMIKEPSPIHMSSLDKAKRIVDKHKLEKKYEIDIEKAYSLYYSEVVGDIQIGIKHIKKVMRYAEEIHDKNLLMRFKSNLAVLQVRMGAYENARDLLEAAIEYYELLKDDFHLMYDYNNLAEVYLNLNEIDKARDLYLKAYDLGENQDEVGVQEQVAIGLSKIYRMEKEYDQAISILTDAVQLTLVFDNSNYIMEVVLELVETYLEVDQTKQAKEALKHCDNIDANVTNLEIRSKYFLLKSKTEEVSGEYKQSLASLKQHLMIHHELNVINSEHEMNEIMENEYKKALDRLEKIAAVGRELTILSSISEVIGELYSIVKDIMEVDAIGISELDEGIMHFSHYLVGAKKVHCYDLSVSTPNSIGVWVVKNQQEVITNNLKEEFSDYVPGLLQLNFKTNDGEEQRIKSLMYAPLIVKGEIIGAFTIQSYKLNAYLSDAIETFRIITNYVAIAIKNIVQARDLEELSSRDSLTGLLNRRGFIDLFDNQVADKETKEICLLMMDLDFFKKVNDTYGHVAGDVVLKKLAEVFKRRAEDKAIFSRLGGEEFGCALVNKSYEDVIIYADKLREEIAELEINIEEAKVHVTISIGVSFSVIEDFEAYKIMYHNADKALYEAKELGRNRVQVYHNL